MKFKDIIKLKEFMINLDETNSAWNIVINNNCNITLQLKSQINIDEDVDVIYYWYDHFVRESNPQLIKDIVNSLDTHNWEQFKNYFYNDDQLKIILPSEAAVFYKNFLIGHITLNKATINLLTYNEYECG